MMKLKHINVHAVRGLERDLPKEALDEIDNYRKHFFDQPSVHKVMAACLMDEVEGNTRTLSDVTTALIVQTFRAHGLTDELETWPAKKKQSMAALLAEVNASAFLGKDVKAPKVRGTKLHKLTVKALRLTPLQLETLLEIQAGTMAVIGGFAAKQNESGMWIVRGTDEDAEEHKVAADLSACTCQDHKYRGRTCKHMKALRRWKGVQP